MMYQDGEPTLLSEEKIGKLSDVARNAGRLRLSQRLGVYLAYRTGEGLVYIGKTARSFLERLAEYTSESDSGRDYPTGELMHQHASELDISIIETPTARQAEELERYLCIERLPKWNAMMTTQDLARQRQYEGF